MSERDIVASPWAAADRVIRSGGALDAELEASDAVVREQVADRRVLVVGGAGTIGSATLRVLLGFRPRSVCVVDSNENGLAELTRDASITCSPSRRSSTFAPRRIRCRHCACST